MATEYDDLKRDVLEQLASAAYTRAYPQIGSTTLQAAMQIVIELGADEARLHIPHYWAVYYHDGRGAFGPREAQFLVYFADPRDDPRINAGVSPERMSDLRRLTRAEFYDGLAENRSRRAQGFPPFMYVIQDADGSPGTVGPAPEHPFFTDGMIGFAEEQSDPNGEVGILLDNFIQNIVDTEINRPRQAGSADFTIKGG